MILEFRFLGVGLRWGDGVGVWGNLEIIFVWIGKFVYFCSCFLQWLVMGIVRGVMLEWYMVA